MSGTVDLSTPAGSEVLARPLERPSERSVQYRPHAVVAHRPGVRGDDRVPGGHASHGVEVVLGDPGLRQGGRKSQSGTEVVDGSGRIRLISEGGAVTGTWSEASRAISGTLQGRGGGGNFEVVASTAGFNANIALRTSGNKQTVTIRADSQFRGANISLSK